MTEVQIKDNTDDFLRDLQASVAAGLESAAITMTDGVRQQLNLRGSSKSAGNQPSPPGKPPANKTGNLFNSIIYEIDGNTATIGVRSSSPANKYAMIHEFGGRINAKNGYLVFQLADESWRKVPFVNIPARPYLRPSLRRYATDAKDAFDKGLNAAMKRRGWFA